MLTKSEYDRKTVSMTTTKQERYKQVVYMEKEEKGLLSNRCSWRYFDVLDYCQYGLSGEVSNAMDSLQPHCRH